MFGSRAVSFKSFNDHIEEKQMMPYKKPVIFCLDQNGHNIDCYLNMFGKPEISVDNENITNVYHFFEKYPDFFKENSINEGALITNFLLTGIQYELILNTESFNKDYAQSFSDEEESDDDTFLFGTRKFDTTKIHSPTIENNQLLFYVKDHNNIPYCVSCQLPFTDPPIVQYSLLPYQ